MSEEKKPSLSKYGKPIGRPKGRKDSDLKKTILAIMSRYRIPELVWKDLQAARLLMTPKERFQASVIIMELGLKACPKELAISGNTESTFRLVIEGLGGKALPGDRVHGDNLPADRPPGEVEMLREERKALLPPPAAPPATEHAPDEDYCGRKSPLIRPAVVPEWEDPIPPFGTANRDI